MTLWALAAGPLAEVSVRGHALAALGAMIGALINATAGGGTLVSYPTLTALGLTPIAANATNMVAMCPGYITGSHAQRREVAILRPILPRQLVCAAVGSLTGALLLVSTDEAVFRRAVPLLILASTALLAAQPLIKRRIAARRTVSDPANHSVDHIGPRQLAALFVTCCYGGYFGAGLGIILLAVTGLYLSRPFHELNALKQVLSIVVGVTAAAFLAFTPHVDWSIVAWMVPGSLVGGALGGRIVGRIDPAVLRAAVVCCGTAVGLVYLWREWG